MWRSGARFDNKAAIAETFSDYDEETWNSVLNSQKIIDDAMQLDFEEAGTYFGKHFNEAINNGVKEELNLGPIKDHLNYDIKSVSYDLENLFTGMDFGEDGIINTFSELKETLESVDEIFD